MAGTSIAFKSVLKNNVKTIHIQNPKLSLNNFDLVLIPEHDSIKGKNVIQTRGALSFFDDKEILFFLINKYKSLFFLEFFIKSSKIPIFFDVIICFYFNYIYIKFS